MGKFYVRYFFLSSLFFIFLSCAEKRSLDSKFVGSWSRSTYGTYTSIGVFTTYTYSSYDFNADGSMTSYYDTQKYGISDYGYPHLSSYFWKSDGNDVYTASDYGYGKPEDLFGPKLEWKLWGTFISSKALKDSYGFIYSNK